MSSKRRPLRSHGSTGEGDSLSKEQIGGDGPLKKKSKKTKHSTAEVTAEMHSKTAMKNKSTDDDSLWETIEKDDAKGSSSGANLSADDSSSDGSGESDADINLEGNIEHDMEDYTFEFNDMRDDYAEGLTVLLKKDLINNPTTAYNLASVIASQTIVGTAITCEGANDTFAFATVLPLKVIQSNEACSALLDIVQELKVGLESIVLKDAPASEATHLLDLIAGSKVCTTGVMLHRRFSNLPLELVGALHANLEEDLGWAKSVHESDDSEQNDFLPMQQILLIATCSCEDKQRGKISNVLGRTDLIFENFDDEIFFQNATSAYVFQFAGARSTLVALTIPVTSLKKCVTSIKQLLPTTSTTLA